MLPISVDACANACSGDTPSASRPTTLLRALSRYAGRIRNGVQICVFGGKLKWAGITPTIVCGTPSTFSTRPITRGSVRNRLRQRASLSTATDPSLAASSPSRNRRPRAGSTPSNGKKPAVTELSSARTGSPAPVSDASKVVKAASCENALSVRSSR